MLQKIHDKASGIFVIVILGALAVVFVFWGTNLDLMTGQTYAAKVDGQKISIEDVRKAYQESLTEIERQTHQEAPAALKEQLRNNAVEGFIQHQLLLQRTASQHYRVSTDDVVQAYQSQPAFQIEGKYSADLAMRRLLTVNLTPAAFERTTRETMQVTQLQDGVRRSQFVMSSEFARAAALSFEQRELSFTVVSAARYVASVSPADAEVNAYYEAHKNEFLTEETVALQYVEMKRDDLMAKQTVTEADLRKYYDDNKDRYSRKERRQARHILVSVAQPADDAAARKKADELYQKLKGGADFEALAKQMSDDPASKPQGGDLGLQEKGGFVGPFDDAVFSMQLHELHAPVKTQFGYHIIRLDGIEPAKQKSFEEARLETEAEFRRNAADREFGERQEKLADLAFSQSGDLAGLAKQMNLEVRQIPEFTRKAGGGLFAANQAVITAAFTDDVLNGGNSEPIELAQGDVIVLRSSGHKSAQPRPLAEVRAAIATRLKNVGAAAKAKEDGAAVLANLNKGSVWDQALAAQNLSVTPRQYVTRKDTTLPKAIREALFAAPRPAAGQVVYRGVTVNDGDYALIAFSGVRDGSSSEADDQRSGWVRELLARQGIGDMAAYTAELERTTKIERNPKALE
jgi:peptidyl-prolyl cis-trans isomerase D